MAKVLSLSEARQKNVTKYNEIPYGDSLVRIGSLGSTKLLEWLEMNDSPEHKNDAGLYLLVFSLIDEDDNRVPEEEIDQWVRDFQKKDASSNSRLIFEAMKLNGMSPKAAQDAKNELGEAPSDASPIDSPSPSVM